jgi:branched-chain amino acid aminotransferase
MSFEKTQWVWHNRKLLSWEDASVQLLAKVVQYGSGVFEGIRCYETADGTAVFRLQSHLDRFRASAAQYDITIHFPDKELKQAIFQTVAINGFRSCYVRPICFYGSGSPGLMALDCPIHVAILAWPWGPLFGSESQGSGVRVTVSKWVKTHFSMLPSTAKACGGYLNSMLAAREARSRGFDEALLLDKEGNVSEGPTENIFIVNNGVVITNDEKSSILLGITRDSVIQIAHDLGYMVEVRAFRLEELASASEAFFTGTAAELTPICEIDGKPVGSGEVGSVTREFQRVFRAATSGTDFRYRHWLDFVTAGDQRAVTPPQ